MTNLTVSASNALTWTAKQSLGTGLTDSKISSTDNSNTVAITAGTSTGQADLVHEKVIELAASGNATFDLSSFAELGSGTTVGFQKVKALQITLEANADESTQATSILVEPNDINGWLGLWKATTSGEYLYKDGALVMLEPKTGITVDSTHKILKFTNQDATNKATLRITVVGIKA
jgi:hypothetical protein